MFLRFHTVSEDSGIEPRTVATLADGAVLNNVQYIIISFKKSSCLALQWGEGEGFPFLVVPGPVFSRFMHLLVSSFWSLAKYADSNIDSGTLVQTDAQPYLYIKSLGKKWLQIQKICISFT
jgi:hypothetical protein